MGVDMGISGISISYAAGYTASRNTGLHLHHGTELVYVQAGSCGNRLEEQEFSGKPGTVFIIPPEINHRQVNHGEVKTIYAVFELDRSNPLLRERSIETAGDVFIPVWMEQLLQLYLAKQLNECNLLLELIVSHLLTRLQQVEHELLHPALARAIRYMAFHFRQPLLIREVSEQAGLSHTYFNTLFREQLHMSPSVYLRKLRLGNARHLLRNSRMSIAEVGIQSGYENSHYFCRIFQQEHHCTPGTYRAENRKYFDKYNDQSE